MSIKILHVEDHEGWRGNIHRRLMMAAGEYEIFSFEFLHEAKQAAAEQEFDIFVCDGSLQVRYDGLEWAKELAAQGKKVILVSFFGENDKPDFQPVFNKADFDSLEFIKAIEEMAS